jgi:hypothetical protein
MRRVIFLVWLILFVWIPHQVRDDMVGLLDGIAVMAQVGSVGIAVNIPISGDSPDASIVCSSPDGYVLCDQPYDSDMFGVISDDPAVEFVGDSLENTRPVLTRGWRLSYQL